MGKPENRLLQVKGRTTLIVNAAASAWALSMLALPATAGDSASTACAQPTLPGRYAPEAEYQMFNQRAKQYKACTVEFLVNEDKLATTLLAAGNEGGRLGAVANMKNAIADYNQWAEGIQLAGIGVDITPPSFNQPSYTPAGAP